MFKLLDEPAWSWPVTVRVPSDGGSYAEQRFEARFRVITSGEAANLMEADPSGRRLMERALIGWADVVDEAGAPLPFAPELSDRLLSIPYVFAAIAGAYTDSVVGASRKN
jgi:hypothetical protein